MNEARIKKQILATVAYYNELEYPLTAFEVWKYLTDPAAHDPQSVALADVLVLLDGPDLQRWIEQDRGFYFLKGQKKMVRERIRRSKIACAKLKRLRRIVFWMRIIPFVRMIAATGRLAMKNAESRSDWDLLVVLEKGRIWTGRTLVTAFAEMIGKRRKGRKIRDRICLNYFITDRSLEIKNKDLFSASEYSFILPLWGGGTFRNFQSQNAWLGNYKPDFQPEAVPNLRLLPDDRFFARLQKMGELIFGWEKLEKYLARIEKRKIEANPLTHQEGSFISATEEALIFLPSPQGPRVFEKFKARIEGLILHNRTTF